MIFKSIGFNSVVLAIFALITAIILATTNDLTRDRIADSERRAAQRALLEIIPLERHNNDMLMDVQPVPQQYWAMLGLKKGGNIHIARDNGQPVAAIYQEGIVPGSQRPARGAQHCVPHALVRAPKRRGGLTVQ